MASCRRVACARPCAACPWRKDTHAAAIPHFSLDLAERLAATSRDARGFGPEFGAPLFACHDSNEGDEIACAGWLAVEGAAHPQVRMMVLGGELDASALEPRDGWPDLHGSFLAVIEELRSQTLLPTSSSKEQS